MNQQTVGNNDLEKGQVGGQVEGEGMEMENELETTEGIKDAQGNVVMKDFSERRSSIKKSKMPMTIRQIIKDKAQIRFDLAEQRNVVWKDEQKSLFIHTLIYGYPFPTAFAVSTNDGFIWMLDGKQRTTTLISYVDNKFKLHKNTPECFGVQIAGKFFNELPEDFREEILNASFDIWEMKNMTNAERAEMFYRLNNGTALSKLEVTRSMYSDFFSEVGELAQLPFFADVISLQDSARNRFVDQELVVQIAMLIEANSGEFKLKGFGGNHIRDYVLDLKAQEGHFPEEMVKLYSKTSRYLEEAFDTYTKKDTGKALKKINVPMVFMQAIEAHKAGMHPAQFGEFIKYFLIEIYNTESAYGVSCQSGSAKKENVMVRLSEMNKAFKKYIKKHPIESYVAPIAKPKQQEEGADDGTNTPKDTETNKKDEKEVKPEGENADKPEPSTQETPKPKRGGRANTGSANAGKAGKKDKEEATV